MAYEIMTEIHSDKLRVVLYQAEAGKQIVDIFDIPANLGWTVKLAEKHMLARNNITKDDVEIFEIFDATKED